MAARPSKRRPPAQPPLPVPLPTAVAPPPPPAPAAGPGPAPVPRAEAHQPRLVADNAGLVGLNLGKSFRRRPVLRNVNIALQRGEAVGLLGPNGAGKTTCFYIITGLITPDYRHHRARRRGHHRSADVPPRAARHRLSAAGSLDLPRPDGRAEYPRRARSGRRPSREVRETTIDELLAEFSITPFAPRAGAGAVGRRTAAGRDRARAGDAARISSCSTSPSPASIRSPSPTSAISSRI